MKFLIPLVVACLSLTAMQLGPAAIGSFGHRWRLAHVCGLAGLCALVGAVIAQLHAAAADWQAAQPSAAQRAVLYTVLTLFAAGCLTPAVYMDAGGESASDLDLRIGSPIGLALLVMGACGWSPWAANLLLLPALGCLGRKRFLAACLLGAVASTVALSSWWMECRWLLGYYLWQASFLALAVGAGVAGITARTGKGTPSAAAAAITDKKYP